MPVGTGGQNGDVTTVGVEPEFSCQMAILKGSFNENMCLRHWVKQKLKVYLGTYRSWNMIAPAICCPDVFDYIST